MVDAYAPWLSPEFAALRDDETLNLGLMDTLSLQDLPRFMDELSGGQLGGSLGVTARKKLCEQFNEHLLAARSNVDRLINDLRVIAKDSGQQANEMDFEFLAEQAAQTCVGRL